MRYGNNRHKHSLKAADSDSRLNQLKRFNDNDCDLKNQDIAYLHSRLVRKKLIYSSSSVEQQGAVLIVVLMLVLLLGTASTLAIRNSQISLDLTRASQVNQLLTQSSDVPLVHLEQLITSPIAIDLNLLSSTNNPIDYLLSNRNKFTDIEYVMCYQPTINKDLYTGAAKHKVFSKEGIHKNPTGYCNIANSSINYYTSGRKVVVTQVSITISNQKSLTEEGVGIGAIKTNVPANPLNNVLSEPLVYDISLHTHYPSLDTSSMDINNIEYTENIILRVYATSIIPSLSGSSILEIDECLSMPVGHITGVEEGTSQGQKECLEKTNTPYNIQVQDYLLTKRNG